MADEADLANDQVEKGLQAVLAAHAKQRGRSDDCIECGVEITEARQNATGGTEYCIECAELVEKRSRQYR